MCTFTKIQTKTQLQAQLELQMTTRQTQRLAQSLFLAKHRQYFQIQIHNSSNPDFRQLRRRVQ